MSLEWENPSTNFADTSMELNFVMLSAHIKSASACLLPKNLAINQKYKQTIWGEIVICLEWT